MLVIKRKYFKKSKEILKDMNKLYYSFSKVTIIHNIDNSFNIILNNNEKTTYWLINTNYLCDIIECLNNSNKSIDFDLQNFIKESLL